MVSMVETQSEGQQDLQVGEILVDAQNITKHFPLETGLIANMLSRGEIPSVKAVDGVSFFIRKGEVFGLAGESGSGKSTIARLVLRLLELTDGKILFNGIDLHSLSMEDMRHMRSRMQLVFQDPLASLNPRMTIGRAIEHPAQIHFPKLTDDQRKERVLEILEAVGLVPAGNFYDLYPHQISGGQRQRIVLARALVTRPELIVADEPIAMADVSVRALLLDQMLELKDNFDLTYLYITHDLATAKYICDRIGILYLGKLVEIGEINLLFSKPLHPYTQALLAAVPVPDPRMRRTEPLPKGEIPNPINPPSGCRFHPRCPYAEEICSKEEPLLRELKPEHQVACHFAEKFV
jgi:peptide/nickel transport system ATP-binding protein